MELVPIVALGTLVYTLMIFLKNLTAQQWRSAATQLIAWVAGICGVFVMAATEFAGGISVGDLTLDKLGFWSKVLVGLLATSMLSTAHEFKKAIDRTDTAAVPDWFEPKAEAAQRAHLVVPAHIATEKEIAQARRTVRESQGTARSAPEHT